MTNKYYKELGRNYGKGVYDMLKHFVSVQIFVNEGDGVLSYDKTIIAYPHGIVDFSKNDLETVEMIDIITGEKYSLPTTNNIGKKVFSKKMVKKIDERLFDLETKKDLLGKSTVTYDVEKFDKTIEHMKNFIATTFGTAKLDEFKPLALSPKEAELKEKRLMLYQNESYLNDIRLAKTCFVSRVDGPLNKNKRKKKIRFVLCESNVPVVLIDGVAYDLRDGINKYPILNYNVVSNGSKFNFLRRIELDEKQYDQIYNDLVNGEAKEYIDGYENIEGLTLEAILSFSNDELKTIVNNTKKLLANQKEKKLVK